MQERLVDGYKGFAMNEKDEIATDIQRFEDSCNEGEARWWDARVLQQLLGYEDVGSFLDLLIEPSLLALSSASRFSMLSRPT